MKDQSLIKQVLSPKTVESTYKGPLNITSIRIHIPDMSECNRSVIGDWGPMYQVELNHDFPIQVEWAEGETWHKAKIQLKSLAVESPPKASEREIHPLHMRIPWNEKQLTLYLHFSPTGQVEFIQFRPNNPEKFWGKIAAYA